MIGCSIGYYLAKAGIRALVMERGRLGREASGAALGVLEACSGDQPYQRLKQKSLSLFHELSGELREGGGIDIELVRCGQLLLSLTEEEEQGLRIQVEQSNELGSDDQWLDYGAVHSLEPALSPRVRGGMYAPNSCRVNNQRLSEAFARAGTGLGAQFRQGSEAIGLLSQGNRVTGARLYGEDIYADQVVLAGGPWTCAIAGWLGVQIPVRPVRGQHVNLQTPGQLLKDGGPRFLGVASATQRWVSSGWSHGGGGGFRQQGYRRRRGSDTKCDQLSGPFLEGGDP